MSKTFTPAEVASHKTADAGLYIIIDSNVYDVTNFVDEHPGGAKILKRVAGKDASKQFWKVCIPSFSSSFFFWKRCYGCYDRLSAESAIENKKYVTNTV